jgi:cytochrome c553
MKKACLCGLLLVAFGGPVVAEPSSNVAWTLETLALVKNGDREKGRQIAETCAACHASGPQPAGTTFPDLQGQLATYLYKQLRDYKDGTRASEIMAPITASLSDKDMADVAAWYSAQPAQAGAKAETVSETAERLVERGDGRRILPSCNACHEADGRGQTIDVPALAGQNPAYTEQTLLDYKSGARHNDIYGRMRTIARELGDEDIRQLARYYAGLKR